MAYTPIQTQDKLNKVYLSETTKQVFDKINANSAEEDTRADRADAKFEAIEDTLAALPSTYEAKFTDGSAGIASVLNDIVTLKSGVAQSGGAISNSSGADIILAKVAKTGAYADLSGKPTIPTKDSDLTNDRYVRYDTSSQGLDPTLQTNARTNIGAGTYSKPNGGIPASDLAESYYLASNPNGYQANVIEGVQLNGSDLTVTNKKVNVQAVTSIGATSGSGIAIGGTATAPTVGIDSSHKLPTTTEYNALATKTYVDTAIDNLPEPMIFKGTLGTGGTITLLPAASGLNEGFTYKVITDGTYASQSAKVGDIFISNGTEWVLIPAGDDIEDTWRAINVNGTQLKGNGITSGAVNFKNGGHVTVTGSGNDITLGVENGYSIPSTTQQNAWTNKMNKANPEGTGKFILNRKSGSSVSYGDYSFTAGYSNVAEGNSSVAFGYGNTASGVGSFVEGTGNTASGANSHAEGNMTTASAGACHAEGFYTKASKLSQHAFGEYNIEDTESNPLSRRIDNRTAYGRYVEIVGNGTAENARSNARTLDWNGNEWIAGNMKVNKTTLVNTASDDITVSLPSSAGTIATQEYVQSQIGSIDQKVVLSFDTTGWTAGNDGYYTKSIATTKYPINCFNSNNKVVMATLGVTKSGTAVTAITIESDEPFAGYVVAL